MSPGAAAQGLPWRVRLPAIVFLLLAGIAVGPVAGWLDPDALFGELLFPLVSLAVGLILFEGALTLRLSEIAGLERVVRRMVGSGALITWAVAATAARGKSNQLGSIGDSRRSKTLASSSGSTLASLAASGADAWSSPSSRRWATTAIQRSTAAVMTSPPL